MLIQLSLLNFALVLTLEAYGLTYDEATSLVESAGW